MSIPLINQIANDITTLCWNDDDSVDKPEYHIERFPGTVFPSDYKCFLIQAKSEIIPEGKGFVLPRRCVVKVADDEWEYTILRELANRKIAVPKTYGQLSSRSVHSSTRLLFEEYIEGHEIWSEAETEIWCQAATEIATIHSLFWMMSLTQSSVPTRQRINNAGNACAYEPELVIAYTKATSRLKKMPFTLLHGDYFATNVIISNKRPVILDWGSSGSGPYIMDLGRFTGTINYDTCKPFCPCADEVVEKYYDAIFPVLKKSKDEYMQDVYAGQFMEIAAYYEPAILRDNSWIKEVRDFSRANRNKLLELAEKME